ncbi:hypothetical protein [Lichenihabitans psoromatis]|uniref:hypothetical protein n=1 Tax=Lichenihabitans psoromatis TaxID=2528642 RepID=UPI001035DE01|nr:hypothetical protein [Lichenihabitans psoromatis]
MSKQAPYVRSWADRRLASIDGVNKNKPKALCKVEGRELLYLSLELRNAGREITVTGIPSLIVACDSVAMALRNLRTFGLCHKSVPPRVIGTEPKLEISLRPDPCSKFCSSKLLGATAGATLLRDVTDEQETASG